MTHGNREFCFYTCFLRETLAGFFFNRKRFEMVYFEQYSGSGYSHKNRLQLQECHIFFIRNHFFLLHKNNNLTIKKENINYLQKRVFTQKGWSRLPPISYLSLVELFENVFIYFLSIVPLSTFITCYFHTWDFCTFRTQLYSRVIINEIKKLLKFLWNP